MALQAARVVLSCSRPIIPHEASWQRCRTLSATSALSRKRGLVGRLNSGSSPAEREPEPESHNDANLLFTPSTAQSPGKKQPSKGFGHQDDHMKLSFAPKFSALSSSRPISHGKERMFNQQQMSELGKRRADRQARDAEAGQASRPYSGAAMYAEEDEEGESGAAAEGGVGGYTRNKGDSGAHEDLEERMYEEEEEIERKEEKDLASDEARKMRRKHDDLSKSARMQKRSYEFERTSSLNPSMSDALKLKRPTTFSELGIHERVVTVMETLGITTPTGVQVQAIPRIQRGESFVYSAETGSGKTLAYLAPFASALHTEHVDNGYVGDLGSPRVIVLQPSLELVEQCFQVTVALRRGCSFRPLKLLKGINLKGATLRLTRASVDVMVTTPEGLLRFVNELPSLFRLTSVSSVVVDECDTLVDKNFRHTLDQVHLLLKEHAGADNHQWIFTGATVPPEAVERIHSIRPNCLHLSSEHVHKPLPNVNYEFYKVSHDQRLDKVMDMLKKSRNEPGQTIIFCNTIPCCDWATSMLAVNKFNVTKLHSNCSFKERQRYYNMFYSGEVQILVCTDIVARGLDTMRVSHVINLDFPIGMADFLHRSGRVGRVGTDLMGRCTSFVVKKKDQASAEIIKECIQKKKVLPKVELW